MAPLRILLFRHPNDKDSLAYEEAIVRAFQGGKEAGGYLATGEDLGIQYNEFSDAPPFSVEEGLNSFCHTLTVVLVGSALLTGGDPLWDWLAHCWEVTDASDDRHSMIVLALNEPAGDSVVTKRPVFESLQLLVAHELGERAIRQSVLALRLLHECRVLLAEGLADTEISDGKLRLFISHAKIDGLPLAYALKRQIEDFPWLEDFYDVDDLPAGKNWKRQLEEGVGSSLIIILRTEVYDSRDWCRQEVLWADEYATPAVLVDARTGLTHAAAGLPLERIPTVRIPDGNLVRILFLALREGLRFLYFMRRIEQMRTDTVLPADSELRVFSFAPSMTALMRACNLLVSAAKPAGTPHYILYPDPPLRAGLYEAAEVLVERYAPNGTRFVTPNTLAASGGVA